ncbi:MAG TPA: SagB family peptide dehydrogenase, partial [Blastocatellia bacterium]|nr:SagB family peptide dehydrogenase [Blastocatellia bacterium]
LYKTGDIGRYLPDGDIEFLGREDAQVKIQGHRIEPGEIEAALIEHPAIKAVSVQAIGKTRENRRLVAYVASDATPAPTACELTDFVKAKLPSYLVPSAFILLRELPLSPNGKLDRSALPDPDLAARNPRREARTRVTPLEQHIADAVARVLGVEQVATDANLLEIGANSIDIVKIAGLLEKDFGFRLKIEDYYRAQSVESLADLYETRILQDQMNRAGGDGRTRTSSARAAGQPELLLDPDARSAFKRLQPGLRRTRAGDMSISLPEAGTNAILKESFFERRSHRHFAAQAIALDQLSGLLGCLRQITPHGKPKYLYASAGGLYPVQVYLHIKRGRVEGLAAGLYYYHPVGHSLVSIGSDVDIDGSIHEQFVNRLIFGEAAFSIFLIAELSAITPLYGDYSLHFATIEAGLMTQLLEMTAPANGIGLCQIGGVDFGRIQHLFSLEESHALIHSLVGGGIDRSRSETRDPQPEAYYHPDQTMIACEEGEL